MLNWWFGLPIAAILVGLGIHFIVLKALRASNRKKQLGRSPEGEELTSPGRSLIEKIEQTAVEVNAFRLCALVQPVLLVAIVIIFRKFNPILDRQFLITAIVACGLVFSYCLWNLFQRLQARKRHRLDYEAEVEVGQALDRLDTEGHRIFHGLRQEGIDIDHAVVGPKGVFIIETKGHPRPTMDMSFFFPRGPMRLRSPKQCRSLIFFRIGSVAVRERPFPPVP